VNIAGARNAACQMTKLVEDEQRMIAHAAEMEVCAVLESLGGAGAWGFGLVGVQNSGRRTAGHSKSRNVAHGRVSGPARRLW